MLLYRPVGIEELRLIHGAGMRAFPPRLPDQPIFYPVLNRGYAQQIARDWNTKSGSRAGFVTQFDVDDSYASRFARHVVGAKTHEELWVPSEELTEFNAHIAGMIQVIDAYYCDEYARAQSRLAEMGASWCAVDASSDEGLQLDAELGRELAPGHVLWEQSRLILGRRADRDDVLFYLPHESRLALVHLTWKRGPETDPRWPSTQVFELDQDLAPSEPGNF